MKQRPAVKMFAVGLCHWGASNGDFIADGTVPVHTDKLSGTRYFFAVLPITAIHHDEKINPRPIGPNGEHNVLWGSTAIVLDSSSI